MEETTASRIHMCNVSAVDNKDFSDSESSDKQSILFNSVIAAPPCKKKRAKNQYTFFCVAASP